MKRVLTSLLAAQKILAQATSHRSLIRTTADGTEIPMTCSVEDHIFTCINDRLNPQILEAGETKTKSQIIINSLIALVLVLSAGLMSGLTVGLASLDRLSLEVEAQGDPAIKLQADRIFSVIDKHHWMLVTLLLCNAGCMEALPLALDKLVPSYISIIISVTAVLAVGEIIP